LRPLFCAAEAANKMEFVVNLMVKKKKFRQKNVNEKFY
jgi:hypothetical protein